MNSFESQRQDSLKRRWQPQQVQDRRFPNINTRFVGAIAAAAAAASHHSSSASAPLPFLSTSNANSNNNSTKTQIFPGLDVEDDLVSSVVPPVTVVLEGRSICQRICLHKHASYQSLAKALRQMFVEGTDVVDVVSSDNDLDLSNAVPGHLIAYEDMENDLLLAGDLNWK
ncbi:AUX/IAA protein [Corchorus capsularis]|uniref:Auxin-responsive protein n=1 Tax=Corchorus capsularis TaxID=210143 RepID=A0A1R3JPY1_COCAP|nr:AUX/IAA protein [Corchorus capsularis]